MTRKNLQVLTAIVVGLVLALLVLEKTDRFDSVPEAQSLLPGFKALANDATRVRIARSDYDEDVTIRREGNAWVVSNRDDYAADVGKLRQLMIALADAKIVEEKTSNPEQYQKLGVDDPEDDGTGEKIIINGDDFSYSVILGKSVQREYRYARVADQSISYLIDRNPNVPQTDSDWLLPDIIDISSEQVRRVSISHADGENIVIEKSEKELTDFTVLDVPDGRELSYASVGNGVADALSELKLQDLRPRSETAIDTTVVYKTWDGLEITAEVSAADDDASWVAFVVEAVPVDSAADSSASDEIQGTGESKAAGQADELNGRLSGWHYQLPDHKKNLLIRRWDDILKDANGD